MAKRWRRPEAKPGQLLVKYGKDCGEQDLFYCHPENTCGMRRDARLLMLAIEKVDVLDGKSLREHLEERGYDITTLKLSVSKLEPEKCNE